MVRPVADQWPITLLPNQIFKVCAFIDLNANGQIDANEPIQESILDTAAPYFALSNWTDY